MFLSEKHWTHLQNDTELLWMTTLEISHLDDLELQTPHFRFRVMESVPVFFAAY